MKFQLMKKICLILLLILTVGGIAWAAGKPAIKFSTKSHDFGTIHAKDGKAVSYTHLTLPTNSLV